MRTSVINPLDSRPSANLQCIGIHKLLIFMWPLDTFVSFWVFQLVHYFIITRNKHTYIRNVCSQVFNNSHEKTILQLQDISTVPTIDSQPSLPTKLVAVQEIRARQNNTIMFQHSYHEIETTRNYVTLINCLLQSDILAPCCLHTICTVFVT